MTYPTPPAPRIAYDLDGSEGFVVGLRYSGGVIQGAPAWLSALNADSGRSARAFAQEASSIQDELPGNVGIALRLSVPTRIRAVAFGGMWSLDRFSPSTARMLLGPLETSSDSTNGIDGTWRILHTYTVESGHDFTFGKSGTFLGEHSISNPSYRERTQAQSGRVLTDGSVPTPDSNSIANFFVSREGRLKGSEETKGWREVFGIATREVRWVRFSTTGYLSLGSGYNQEYYLPTDLGALFKLHLYGEPDTSASPHRLSLVTTSGASLSSLDWGDVPPGSIKTRTFRVKNLSPTLTAVSPEVAIEKENPIIPESPSSWVSLSTSGSSSTNSLVLDDLGPGELSEPITLTLEVQGTVVGSVAPRISVVTEEWF